MLKIHEKVQVASKLRTPYDNDKAGDTGLDEKNLCLAGRGEGGTEIGASTRKNDFLCGRKRTNTKRLKSKKIKYHIALISCPYPYQER